MTVEAATRAEVANILAVTSPDVIVTNIDTQGEHRYVFHESVHTTKVRPKVLYTDLYLTRVDLGLSGECAPFAELIDAVEDYLTAEG